MVHRDWLDRSAHASGTLHSWDPRLKVAVAAMTLVVISFGARSAGEVSWSRLGLIAIAIGSLTGLAGIPYGRMLRRSLIVLPFAGFVAVAALFAVIPGGAAGDGPGLHLGGWSIIGAPGGGERALRILARAWLSILTTLILVQTTPLPAILAALERWHVPRGFLEACSLVYRYLWVLLEEGRRLLLARKLRGGRVAPWKSGGRILASLFARSLARAQRIEVALRLRGYDGTLPLGRSLEWTGRDSRRLAVATALLVAAIWAPEWGGGIG